MASEADARFLRKILGLLVAATIVTGVIAGFASVRAASEFPGYGMPAAANN